MASDDIPALTLVHTGLVCKDMDAAQTQLQQSMGLQWVGGQPETWALTLFGEKREITLRIAHGYLGNNAYELIEACPNTPWLTDTDISQHHLCFHSTQPALTVANLEQQGFTRVLGAATDSTGYFQDPEGLLIEIIDDGLLHYLEKYYQQSRQQTDTR
jgi:catechol 2,3-dioxygenase-like lactoylglutathione lyase family enzyme